MAVSPLPPTRAEDYGASSQRTCTITEPAWHTPAKALMPLLLTCALMAAGAWHCRTWEERVCSDCQGVLRMCEAGCHRLAWPWAYERRHDCAWSWAPSRGVPHVQDNPPGESPSEAYSRFFTDMLGLTRIFWSGCTLISVIC